MEVPLSIQPGTKLKVRKEKTILPGRSWNLCPVSSDLWNPETMASFEAVKPVWTLAQNYNLKMSPLSLICQPPYNTVHVAVFWAIGSPCRISACLGVVWFDLWHEIWEFEKIEEEKRRQGIRENRKKEPSPGISHYFTKASGFHSLPNPGDQCSTYVSSSILNVLLDKLQSPCCHRGLLQGCLQSVWLLCTM